MTSFDTQLQHSILGKATQYLTQYTPDLLFPILREPKRSELKRANSRAFFGYDLWNAYELSWLNKKGKPQVAIGTILFPCDTPKLIESKSVKLYFNSLNQTQFTDLKTVEQTICRDLSQAAGGSVEVKIQTVDALQTIQTHSFSGQCIDHLDITVSEYQVNPQLLHTKDREVEVKETLYSHLFKSICLATGQPDWASIIIAYQGKQIHHESLLKYLISYRHHSEFHEQCIERVFMDLLNQCCPKMLTVEARFTRRGGIDINPFRSTQRITMNLPNHRHIRQ